MNINDFKEIHLVNIRKKSLSSSTNNSRNLIKNSKVELNNDQSIKSNCVLK